MRKLGLHALPLTFRFAVGTPNGPRSGSWKLWSQGDDAYLLWRALGGVDKFSFHKSGICRWASTRPRPDGSDRAVYKWRRGPVPDAGPLRGTLLIALGFPTDHLSTAFSDLPGPLRWIDPAPPGMGLGVELYLIRDTEAEVRNAFARVQQRTLLAFGALRNGANLIAVSTRFTWKPFGFRILGAPPVPGQVFGEMNFPEVDTENTGRPARALMRMP